MTEEVKPLYLWVTRKAVTNGYFVDVHIGHADTVPLVEAGRLTLSRAEWIAFRDTFLRTRIDVNRYRFRWPVNAPPDDFTYEVDE